MTSPESRARLHLAARILKRVNRLADGRPAEVDGELVNLGELANDLVEIANDLVIAEAVDRIHGMAESDEFGKRISRENDETAGRPFTLIPGGRES